MAALMCIQHAHLTLPLAVVCLLFAVRFMQVRRKGRKNFSLYVIIIVLTIVLVLLIVSGL